MKLLLDTHTVLWFALGDARISQTARELIEAPAAEKWVSPATHWELAIKISIGKYSLPGRFSDFIRRAVTDNGFRFLSIAPPHTESLIDLPFHHRDPFDRLMIAQAIVEGMDLVSADDILDQYAINRRW